MKWLYVGDGHIRTGIPTIHRRRGGNSRRRGGEMFPTSGIHLTGRERLLGGALQGNAGEV